MNRGLKNIREIFLVLLILVSISLISAAEIKTTDFSGNIKTDFSPHEVVYIRGFDFLADNLIFIKVTNPDGVMRNMLSVSDSSGYFLAIYVLDDVKGDYLIVSNDGVNSATAYFSDAAIWTTKSDCGDSTQDTNLYDIGDAVFINGDGFAAGSYSWSITGKPGGASCDPGIVVASGTKTVDASGAFCFNAYNVSNGDCGEYQVKFDVKGDNYRVTGNACNNDADCGTQDSQVICSGINVVNVTTTPDCIRKNCTFINSNQTIKTCDKISSQLLCQNNNVVNVTTTQDCADGGCINITNPPIIVRDCGTTSSEIRCDGNNIVNATTVRGCTVGSCFNNTFMSIIRFCTHGCLNAQCVCVDTDKDGVCDDDDKCPKTPSGEDVDEDGCSNPQFCAKQSECGNSCDLADWKGNEQNKTHPNDCMTIVIEKETVLKPYCAGLTCAD